MGQADDIRNFVYYRYILPARNRSELYTTVRSGDVHKEMGLSNAMPNVCSALESAKFAELVGVHLIKRTGPHRGGNARFGFGLTGSTQSLNSAPSLYNRPRTSKRARDTAFRSAASKLDFSDAVVLVSCVKSKRAYPTEARDLYTSAWFTKVRNIVETGDARWFVLSSLYGLIKPDEVKEPYDYTLNKLGVATRRQWAAGVEADIQRYAFRERRIILFAGQRYREFLIGPLERMGFLIEIPMVGLTRGKQLEWLCRN